MNESKNCKSVSWTISSNMPALAFNMAVAVPSLLLLQVSTVGKINLEATALILLTLAVFASVRVTIEYE